MNMYISAKYWVVMRTIREFLHDACNGENLGTQTWFIAMHSGCSITARIQLNFRIIRGFELLKGFLILICEEMYFWDLIEREVW